MKTRILCLACAAAVAALFAGCSVYKNSDACQQMMRSKLAETSSDKLTIDHTGAAIRGSRVVVEGTIEHVQAASAVAAASGAGAASAPAATSAASAPAASAATGASAPVAASGTSTAAAKTASAKPKPTRKGAAVECTFDRGGVLAAFRWLAPDELVKAGAGDGKTE